MATQLLLKEDIDGLGLSGEIVKVKPGYARNYLLPKGLAVIANKQALRMQERLREQRRAKALLDKQEAEAIAARIGGVTVVSCESGPRRAYVRFRDCCRFSAAIAR